MVSWIGPHLRIISIRPSRDDAPDSAARDTAQRMRGFDYARLLRRRASPHRPVEHAAPDGTHLTEMRAALTPADGGNTPHAASRGGHQSHEDPTEPHSGSSVDESSESRALLAERIVGATAPIATAVLAHDWVFIQLFATLAREVAAFCTDPAIVTGGYWDARLLLDKNVFPNTILNVTLSPLSLQLRFEAMDAETRQLILQHSTRLERELNVLLHAWSEVRYIELSVW